MRYLVLIIVFIFYSCFAFASGELSPDGNFITYGNKKYEVKKSSGFHTLNTYYPGVSIFLKDGDTITVFRVFYTTLGPNTYAYHSYSVIKEVPYNVDSDDDGLSDDHDPCPDSKDDKFRVWRVRNICEGFFYMFEISGECLNSDGSGRKNAKMYVNSGRFESQDAALAAAASAGDCAVIDDLYLSGSELQDFFDGPKSSNSTASPGDNSPSIDGKDPVGNNSTLPYDKDIPKPESDDPNIQKLIDQIERIQKALSNDLYISTKNLAASIDSLKESSAYNQGRTNSHLSGINKGISDFKDQSHADANRIIDAISKINSTIIVNMNPDGGGDDSGSLPGSINKPGEPTTLEPVSEDRITEAKLRFDNAWASLKASVSGIFDANLGGSGRLPIWHWQVLGKSVVIDFNKYSTELNWIGLAGLFMASLSAIFIVLGK